MNYREDIDAWGKGVAGNASFENRRLISQFGHTWML